MTLRVRLSLAFVLVVLVPLVVGAILVGRGVPAALRSQVSHRLVADSGGVSQVLAGYCDQVTLAAQVLALDAAAGGATAPPAAARRLVESAGVDFALVTAPSGKVLGSAGSLPPRVPRPVDPARLGSCHATGGSPYVIAESVPIKAPGQAGTGLGTVALSVDQALARALRPTGDADADVTLVRDDEVITSTLAAADARRVATHARKAVLTGGSISAGGQLIAAAGAGPGRPLTVLVSAPLPRNTWLIFLLALVVIGSLVASVFVGWQLARVTTRPLAELSEAAARVAGGDLDTHIPVRTGDEVGRLGAAFNDMTDELRTYIRALESSRDELRRNLVRLGETLSSTHDLNGILGVILDTAMASVRAEAGGIFLSAATRGDLYLKVGRGLEERGVPPTLRVRVGDGVTGLVAATGEPLRGLVGQGAGELRTSAEEPAARSLIAVPLKRSGRVIGVLDLYDRVDAEGFDQGDLATIRTFAAQATVAIDNVLLHQEAQRLSITDGLTGLWNYRYFQMQFSKEIERASRFGRPLSLLMLDLDHFKLVNDEHGHQRGDSVLVELAQRVKAEIREVDTLARYGGEELVLILPETDLAGARGAAERIRAVIAHLPFGQPPDEPLAVTVSIGAAVFPDHGATAASLLRQADEALYAAKAAGRDTWRVAGDALSVPTAREEA